MRRLAPIFAAALVLAVPAVAHAQDSDHAPGTTGGRVVCLNGHTRYLAPGMASVPGPAPTPGPCPVTTTTKATTTTTDPATTTTTVAPTDPAVPVRALPHYTG